MKTPIFICTLIIIIFFNTNHVFGQRESHLKKVKKKEFSAILDSTNVTGSILILDYYSRAYYSNDFKHCKQGYLPASTFKIVNSIIGLETGVIENENTIFKWDEKPRSYEIWNQDLNFHDAFHYSCVPCYQEVARDIGSKSMNEYLTKLDYGKMKVDSTNIDIFWLEGDSRITQFEQIDFIKRFYNDKIGIAKSTTQKMKDLMIIDKTPEYTLSGKTGWVVKDGNDTGWFVGYIEKDNNIYFIATNIQPEESCNMDIFPRIRIEITLNAFKTLGIIEN